MSANYKSSDGISIPSRVYLYVLDFNDKDDKKYMSERFKKQKLEELTCEEFVYLFDEAATRDNNKLWKDIPR